ncbi:MAG: thioredoxin-disulfide reductase [Candidatus Komeilibacteria bacterium]|jgi:thioredoxin reductase (NADPH)|nr:thioredoxin-disulfide reductase [Candidatus Komeilibacteria bacterium]MBT4447208.1 thioredoxin-disulfide reductase [Candidatus Komeilibacteria bacterium]
MEDKIYDVVIIGAGPSGLTAAIYTSRRAMETLVVSKDIGGQMALTDDIGNYPGFELIAGLDLAQKFKTQAEKTGTKLDFKEIVSINKEDKIFTLKTTDNSEFKAKSVILAFGLTPRNLEVPGEKEFTGRGVSYCATCDGPLYKDKTVVVVGGGNSALDAAEYTSKLAKQVYLIHRRDTFRGEQVLIDQVKATKNIEIIYDAVTSEIKGDTTVSSYVYKTKDGKKHELTTDGIFIEVGHVAKTDWLGDLVEYTDRKEIKISRDCETKTPGLFAAGDITEITYKQAVISAGEGSKAALQAYKFLQGDKPLAPDWTPKK